MVLVSREEGRRGMKLDGGGEGGADNLHVPAVAQAGMGLSG